MRARDSSSVAWRVGMIRNCSNRNVKIGIKHRATIRMMNRVWRVGVSGSGPSVGIAVEVGGGAAVTGARGFRRTERVLSVLRKR